MKVLHLVKIKEVFRLSAILFIQMMFSISVVQSHKVPKVLDKQ